MPSVAHPLFSRLLSPQRLSKGRGGMPRVAGGAEYGTRYWVVSDSGRGRFDGEDHNDMCQLCTSCRRRAGVRSCTDEAVDGCLANLSS